MKECITAGLIDYVTVELLTGNTVVDIYCPCTDKTGANVFEKVISYDIVAVGVGSPQ